MAGRMPEHRLIGVNISLLQKYYWVSILSGFLKETKEIEAGFTIEEVCIWLARKKDPGLGKNQRSNTVVIPVRSLGGL